MTKISQLSSIGDSLAVDDQFLIRDVSDGSTPNKSVTVSGITRALDLGTAAAPAIAFATDKNTGIYSPGADQVAVATSGSGRLFVDASGNIGLGTSVFPYATGGRTCLDINGSSTSLINLKYGNAVGLTAETSSSAAAITAGGTTIPLVFYTNATERLRITSAGLVGVGTSSPDALFEASVNSSSIAYPVHITNSVNYGWGVGLKFRQRITSGGSLVDSAAVTSNWISDNNSDLRFATTASGTLGTRLTITPAGNVGVGTTSPGSLLHAAGKIRFGSNATYYGEIDHDAGSTGANIYDHSDSGGHIFRKNGTEQLRIDSSGRLLVGTSSALTALSFSSIAPQIQLAGSTTSAASILAHKFGDDADPCKLILLKNRGIDAISNAGLSVNDPLGVISFEAIDGYGGSTLIGAEIGAYAESGHGSANDDGPARLVFSTTADGASSPTERMRISQNGIVSINGTGSIYNARLTCFSQTGVSASAFSTDTATEYGTILRNTATSGNNGFALFETEATPATRGSITYNRGGGVVAYNTTSDYRAKTLLGVVENPGETIDALKIYRGVMNGATVERPMLVAHEAQEVAPYCVTGEKDAVDDDGNPIYQQMDHQVLVPLLIAEIQQLRARVAALETQ